MRALIFVHSPTVFAVDGDSEPLRRFTVGGLYASQEAAIMPGQQKELAPGIYATLSDSSTVRFHAQDPSREGADYDVLLSRGGGDDKDEWPSIMADASKLQRIRPFIEAQGVSSDAQLKSFFGELSVG